MTLRPKSMTLRQKSMTLRPTSLISRRKLAAGYEPSSERVTEEAYLSSEGDYLIYLFHLATYDFTLPYVQGKRVLDFGCGTGYGAHRIAASCASVMGVDVSADAVSYAQSRYSAPNLEFRTLPPVEDAPLPFADGSIEVVLSFQVIEHVPEPAAYLSEVRRVLADDGVFIVATPDRSTRLLSRQRPWNRYHVYEWAPDEFDRLLRDHFGRVEMHGMGAEPAVLGGELRRASRTKWVTLPFTFPGAPEPWRQTGLRAIKAARTRVSGLRKGSSAPRPEPSSFGFDQSAVRIEPGIQPSVNIVAVASGRPTD